MKTVLPFALAAALAAASAAAVEPAIGAQVGTTAAGIVAAMAESGYDVTKFEREGAVIEARVVKEGRSARFSVDADTGRIAALRDGGPLAAGARLGASPEEIAASLTAQGYDVRKIEREHDKVEVKAMRNGRRYELYVDPASGLITRVKEDD